MKYIDQDRFNAIRADGPFVFAVWHEHIIGLLKGHEWTEPYLTLASRSKDGDFAAFIATKMGFANIRGSSRKKNVDKGGKEAMDEYIQRINQGSSGGLTVDGPKGPRHVCKIGVAVIAQKSGRPILPMIAVASKQWTINSWDKFKIPKPFSTITIRYGHPLFVREDATPDDLNEICRAIEAQLLQLESLNDMPQKD